MGRDHHHKGMVGEGRFIAFAASRGWDLYRGVDGHTPCDFIIDDGRGLWRVEVKRCEAVQRNDGGAYYCLMTKLDAKRFDFLFVSTPLGDYWIPASECPKTLSIRQPANHRRQKPGKYEVYRVEQV